MAISFIAAGAAEANSITIPGSGTYATGDLMIIWAFNSTSTTVPTFPTGWTQVLSSGSNTGTLCASACGYKFATSGSETSGTWTNASEICCQIYRGTAASSPLVNAGAQTGNSTTVNYSGITTMTGPSTSWVVRFVGMTSINNSPQTPPTGYTNRSDIDGLIAEAAGHDTNGAVSSCSFQSVNTGGTAGNYISKTVELLAASGGGVTAHNLTMLGVGL